MRSLIFVFLIAFITFCGCAKKPDTYPNTVSIQNRIYRTVVIGSQTWTTQNYDGPGGVANTRESTIGKFYIFSELSSIALPAGWRIPTKADFIALLTSQGSPTVNNRDQIVADSTIATHLMATSEWPIPGDNKTGFNAFPAGMYYVYQRSFETGNDETIFWSSTIDSAGTGTNQWVLQMIGFDYIANPINGQNAYVNFLPKVGYGYNLRFVKDN